MDAGFADIGFAGSDKIDEAQLGGRWQNIASKTIAYAGCSLVVASNTDSRVVASDGRIATSYPNMTRRWIRGRGWAPFREPNIVLVTSGATEGYIGVNGVNAIVDIRERGQTLLDNRLPFYQEIEPIETKIAWREE